MQVDELIEGCRRGSKSHFSELYDRFSPVMYSICLRYSGSAEEAEDILQEGFINVFMQLKTYDKAKGPFEGWLRKIFVHKAIDYLRKKTIPLNGYPVDLVDENSLEEKEGLPIDLLPGELLEMVRSLPLGYRTVFNLHVVEEKSHKEIGELLGISENTSKTQFMKARKTLREKIKKRLPAPAQYRYGS